MAHHLPLHFYWDDDDDDTLNYSIWRRVKLIIPPIPFFTQRIPRLFPYSCENELARKYAPGGKLFHKIQRRYQKNQIIKMTGGNLLTGLNTVSGSSWSTKTKSTGSTSSGLTSDL